MPPQSVVPHLQLFSFYLVEFCFVFLGFFGLKAHQMAPCEHSVGIMQRGRIEYEESALVITHKNEEITHHSPT